MLATDTSSPPSYRASRDAVPTNSVPCRMDDEARSFCDSISSITCSSFAEPDADRQKAWTIHKRKVPNKIAKFQAIEKWLQNLPEPVMKPGSEKSNRNVTFGGHLSDEGRVLRKRVYNMDQTFLRKLGHKNGILEKHSIAAEPHQTNRKAGLKNSLHCGVDEDARSFCDSVSSIACSSFAKDNKEANLAQHCRAISDKIAKFDAIEKWLQNLPTPTV
ncbi:hypothetical protein ACROYT_G020163 [Oculina patagonica]